jgi:phosphatidate cytidylyltransferase
VNSGLRKRIATGLVLAISVIAAVSLLTPAPLAAVLGGVVAISAWEWSRLMSLESLWSRLLCVLVAVVGMLALYMYCDLGGNPRLDRVQPLLGLACLWWAIALLWVRGFPASAGLWGNRLMLSLIGLLVLLPPWLSVVYLRSYDMGRLLLLAMVVVVAFADIGAYFTGKAWGKRKLAAAVSPGKSWEGFWGGQVTCVALALLLGLSVGVPRLSLAGLVAIVACTALASVLGDLVESMVKRHRGVKDSGILLPGHGGFLDRIDGITAAAPVYALGLILAGWTP